MNAKSLMTAASLCMALSVPMTALAHADHGKPQFGGIVAEAGEAQFEIVPRDGKVVVHTSHHGSPVTMSGASGKLTILDGSKKSEIILKAAGDNRLEGGGTVPAGAKLLLNVQMPGGKTLQARSQAH